MKRFGMAIAVVCVIAALVAGCGGGGGTGGGGGGNTPPPLGGGTTLTGKVQSSKDGSGLANVLITFGTPSKTTRTRADGTFTLDLGNVSVLSLFPTPPYTFSVDTSGAGAYYPNNWPVEFSGLGYFSQNAITVPQAVLTLAAGGTANLGTITATYVNPDDQDNPPPPPTIPGGGDGGGGGGGGDNPPPPPLGL